LEKAVGPGFKAGNPSLHPEKNFENPRGPVDFKKI